MPAQALEDAEFPVDSFREAAPHLRRPFTADAVKWKVQRNLGSPENPSAGMIVGYIDARLAIDRLNLVIPHLWATEYELQGRSLWCRLTVDGITRSDVGEGEGKALVSDALKRAAVHFGVAVSVYAFPQTILRAGGDPAALVVRGDRKKRVELTPEGIGFMRNRYQLWLDQHGTQAFGKPLDHGDIADEEGVAAEAAMQEGEPSQARLQVPQADRVQPQADVPAKTHAIMEGSGHDHAANGGDLAAKALALLKASGDDLAEARVKGAKGNHAALEGLIRKANEDIARKEAK